MHVEECSRAAKKGEGLVVPMILDLWKDEWKR
jgi:hypothetical protein